MVNRFITAGQPPAFVRRHNRRFNEDRRNLECSRTLRLRPPCGPLAEQRLAHAHPAKTNARCHRANITSGTINVILRVTPRETSRSQGHRHRRWRAVDRRRFDAMKPALNVKRGLQTIHTYTGQCVLSNVV